jgi:hypothetical protein
MFGRLKRIEQKLDQLIQQGEREMGALADLQAADATIKAAVAAAVTLIQGFVNGTVNADDPGVEAVVADLNAAAAALGAASIPTPPTPPVSSSAVKS